MIDCLPWGQFDENTYVVGDESECFIIDPGAPADEIAKLVKERRVLGVLLTHTHLDHIIGVDDVRDKWSVELWAPSGEEAGLTDPMVNLSGLFGLDIRRRAAERIFNSGERFRVGKYEMEVRSVPGHSPAHVVFVGPGFVIAGDTLFAGSIGRTDFPGSSRELLLKKINEELLTLPDDTAVWPGHGPSTTIGTERRHNPFLAV